MMLWNQAKVGAVLQAARLTLGLSLAELGELASVKMHTVSELEKGIQCRPPRPATVERLEAVLGVKLPITYPPEKRVTIRLHDEWEQLLAKVKTKWPELSVGAGIMEAVKSWERHEAAVEKWNAEHPGANLTTD